MRLVCFGRTNSRSPTFQSLEKGNLSMIASVALSS